MKRRRRAAPRDKTGTVDEAQRRVAQDVQVAGFAIVSALEHVAILVILSASYRNTWIDQGVFSLSPPAPRAQACTLPARGGVHGPTADSHSDSPDEICRQSPSELKAANRRTRFSGILVRGGFRPGRHRAAARRRTGRWCRHGREGHHELQDTQSGARMSTARAGGGAYARS